MFSGRSPWADINFAIWGIREYEFAEEKGGTVSRDGGRDGWVCEVVLKGELEVDADGGLSCAGEGDFAGGWVAGDDLREGGLVKAEVRFSGC